MSLNSGVNSGSPSWPNRIGGRGKVDHGTPLRFFNATLCPAGETTLPSGAVCAFQTPAANTYGNVARSVLYGPTTKDWDIGLQRRIKLYEDKSLNLKFDAFNAFNTPNFSTPNTAIGSAQAGQIRVRSTITAICRHRRRSTSKPHGWGCRRRRPHATCLAMRYPSLSLSRRQTG